MKTVKCLQFSFFVKYMLDISYYTIAVPPYSTGFPSLKNLMVG